jgi:universal stress protein E
MKTPASILVIVDRGECVAEYLARTVGLARRCGARIELFLCEAAQAYVFAHQFDQEGVERARAECLAGTYGYLRDLRARLDAEGIEMSLTAACESPLYEGIVHRVLRSKPDLVIKRATTGDSKSARALDPNDWQLMRTCPSTVMLTRGRPWHVPARFAAAIDVSKDETAGLPENVLDTARVLACEWGAALDVLYAEAWTATPLRTHLEELRRLCQAGGVPFDRTHVLYGDPDTTLPAFAARQDYDLLVLGALAHRPATSALLGGLTSKLVESLDCDFVLVKPPSYRSPIGKDWERLSAVQPAATPTPAE